MKSSLVFNTESSNYKKTSMQLNQLTAPPPHSVCFSALPGSACSRAPLESRFCKNPNDNSSSFPVCFKELQRDMQGSTQALAEIVRNTEIFLKESGDELSQEDKALIEQKLNEAKVKCEQLNLKAEQSTKELDKAVTAALKEETEKVPVPVWCTVASPGG